MASSAFAASFQDCRLQPNGCKGTVPAALGCRGSTPGSWVPEAPYEGSHGLVKGSVGVGVVGIPYHLWLRYMAHFLT